MILNTASLVRSFDRVYSNDPAILREGEWQEALDRFHREGNLDVLPLAEGKKPCVWRLKNLRGQAKLLLQSMLWKISMLPEEAQHAAYASAAYVACKLALDEVVGLKTDKGDPVQVRKVRDGDTGLMVASDELMESLYDLDSGGLVMELGTAVIQRLAPDPT